MSAEDGEIFELVVAGEFGGFPDLAFGEFAVADEDVDARGAFIEARADGQACAYREALAQRAGGCVYAGDYWSWMAFEFAG